MKVQNLLVSQPKPAIIEKSPFFELARKHKVEVIYRPFIRVVGVSLKEFRAQRVEILDHTAVIFTSRTTVDSFFHICEEARITVPETMKYICQTEAVALYLSPKSGLLTINSKSTSMPSFIYSIRGLFLLMIQSSLPILIINCFLIPFAHKLSAGSPILSFRIPQSNHGL